MTIEVLQQNNEHQQEENNADEVVETRDEEGNIVIYTNFLDAFNAIQQNPTIWKFSIERDGMYGRWVRKNRNVRWSDEEEAKLVGLSGTYEHQRDVLPCFWVQQTILPPGRQQMVQGPERDAACIQEVASFVELFNMFLAE